MTARTKLSKAETKGLTLISACFKANVSPIQGRAFSMLSFEAPIFRPDLSPVYPLDQDIHFCDTAHCIGGYLRALIKPKKEYDDLLDEEILYPLFYPNWRGGPRMWPDITPLHAAYAIDQVLAGLKPDWTFIMDKGYQAIQDGLTFAPTSTPATPA